MKVSLRACALAFLAALAVGAYALDLPVKGTTMSVQVKETQIRSLPSFSGKVLALAVYGDKVTVLEAKSGWVRAKSPDGKAEGWINLSALTSKEIAKSTAKGSSTGVSGSEVALAGKGFSKQVEDQYKAGGKVDYTWVDRMEAMGQPLEACIAFLSEGGVAAEAAE